MKTIFLQICKISDLCAIDTTIELAYDLDNQTT